jgi:hypothetical protein
MMIISPTHTGGHSEVKVSITEKYSIIISMEIIRIAEFKICKAGVTDT